MEAYAKVENISSEKLNEIEDMKRNDIRESLKVFAYDFVSLIDLFLIELVINSLNI